MISVCIATFNGEKFIKEQLYSIAKQLGDSDEIIISDDCSTDKTIEYINALNDKRIKVFTNTKGKVKRTFDHATHNFENALMNTKGDIIFLSDQDDVWLDNRIEHNINLLKVNDLVITDCKVVDSSLNVIEESYFTLLNSGPGIFKNILKNSYLGCCMAFNKNILSYILPFPKYLVPHDIWIGLNVELRGKVYFSNASTLLYRRHGNNLSATSGKSSNSLIFKLTYRLAIIYNLIKRYFQKSL